MKIQANRLLLLTKKSLYDFDQFNGSDQQRDYLIAEEPMPRIFFIPRGDNTGQIPCLFYQQYPCLKQCKLLLYFHGMGEDLAEIQHEMNYIRRRCKVNVLGVEYPGYGLNWDEGLCSEELMVRDAKAVLKFAHNELKIEFSDILVVGRSIGTGVASQLVKQMPQPPGMLVLCQPFVSIIDLLKGKLGPLGCLTGVLRPRFQTDLAVQDLSCPLLVIHGDQDPLIPMTHGQRVFDLAMKTEKKEFCLRPGCTHISYNRDSDIAVPIAGFMKTFNISSFMEATKPQEDALRIEGLPDSIDGQNIFSKHLHLRLRHSGSRNTYFQQSLIALRIVEQVVLGGFMLHFYARDNHRRSLVAGIFCLLFAVCDLLAGLVFGHWNKNPIGLLVLYIVEWIAAACYIGLGYAFIGNQFVITIVLWAQILLFYFLFSFKLHG